MNKVINPPSNSWKQATSFIMLDEKKKKKKSRVVVGGGSSRHVEGSGAAPDVVVSPYDQFPPDPPIVREAVVSSGDVRRRVEDEGTEADEESEIISVGGSLSIVGGCMVVNGSNYLRKHWQTIHFSFIK